MLFGNLAVALVIGSTHPFILFDGQLVKYTRAVGSILNNRLHDTAGLFSAFLKLTVRFYVHTYHGHTRGSNYQRPMIRQHRECILYNLIAQVWPPLQNLHLDLIRCVLLLPV